MRWCSYGELGILQLLLIFAWRYFEEQAIQSEPCKPKIWKGSLMIPSPSKSKIVLTASYNISTVNSHPPILPWRPKITTKIAFLNKSVCREPDICLTTSIYRKPTHTDQYLAYDSHHPQSVKRSILKCLYNRVKGLVTIIYLLREEHVICTCFQKISLLLCAEDHKNNIPKTRAHGKV